MATVPTPATEPRCLCGHGREHPAVEASCSYSTLGYISLFFGASVRPLRVRFHCKECHRSFFETEDPAICSRFA